MAEIRFQCAQKRKERVFFCSIPLEVRELIYTYTFSCNPVSVYPRASNPLCGHTDLLRPPKVHHALLRTCKGIYEEAASIYLTQITEWLEIHVGETFDMQTLLLWIGHWGPEAVVKLTLERHNINTVLKDNEGMTSLSWAAVRGHETVVKLLLERPNVNADSKENEGRTPLSLAAAAGEEPVVKLLVKRNDVHADSKDIDDRTPLSWAARNGHEAVVKQLVERKDVKANSKDQYGRTPLSWAVVGEHEAVVRVLMEINDVEA